MIGPVRGPPHLWCETCKFPRNSKTNWPVATWSIALIGFSFDRGGLEGW